MNSCGPVHLNPNVLPAFCQRHSIRELSLFGSVTRDDFQPSSDVDVLIKFEPDARTGLFEFIKISEELRALVGHEVDLVTKASLSPYFRDEAMANREVVYVQP